MKKVSLFTDFSPTSGGGAAILRSLLKGFKNLQVQWFYIAETTVDLPGTLRIASLPVTANPFGHLVDFCRLWSGFREKELVELARPIWEGTADVHWVVAHGVGIGIGNVLKMLRPEIPLHVTVHDDPEHGLLKRSRRYRFLARMVRKPMHDLMANADSVDVISRAMREYYLKQFSTNAEVVHLFVDKLPLVRGFLKADNELRVGHIGSIYSRRQFANFLRGVDCYSVQRNLKPVFKVIGKQVWPAERFAQGLSPGASVRLLGQMEEEDAISQLADCDFVYASYPFGEWARIFRQTSLPTKLSTYVKAQRPIFAHAPLDSTLASVATFQIGVVCPHSGIYDISRHVEEVRKLKINSENFEICRENIFGAHNISRLENLLLRA